MQSTTVLVLTAFIVWTLFLLVLMEGLRIVYLFKKTVAANEFRPDNSNLPPFMQRLARAHANCFESFPIIGGVLIVALLTSQTAITDPLAPWLIVARVIQSAFHMISNNLIFVNLRFLAFVVQMVIVIYWLWELLAR